MFIGCIDCGKPMSECKKREWTERPRIAKSDGSGWNNTIDCCKSCLDKWLEKHPEYKSISKN